MLHQILMLNTMKILTKKYPKFKVGDHVRMSKYKNIYTKGYTQNWPEEIFMISKIKNTVPWTYVISDLNGEPITGKFYEKELQKTSQEKFRIEKVIKEKVINCTSNRKGMIVVLIVGLIKWHCIKMSQYFPRPFRCFGQNINVDISKLIYQIMQEKLILKM